MDKAKSIEAKRKTNLTNADNQFRTRRNWFGIYSEFKLALCFSPGVVNSNKEWRVILLSIIFKQANANELLIDLSISKVSPQKCVYQTTPKLSAALEEGFISRSPDLGSAGAQLISHKIKKACSQTSESASISSGTKRLPQNMFFSCRWQESKRQSTSRSSGVPYTLTSAWPK